jgi:hypothetical protein
VRACQLVAGSKLLLLLLLQELRSSAGNNQKSYKIMKMKMFATLDKANRDTGNIKGLNLAAVKNTTVQVTRLLL